MWFAIWICPLSTNGCISGWCSAHELLTPLAKNVSRTGVCIALARLRLAGVTRLIRYGGRCDGPCSLSLAAVVPTAFDVVRAWACPFRRGQGRGHRRGPLSVA